MNRTYVVTCRDAPGTAELRATTRAAHDAHIDALGDAMLLGAALSAPDGSPAGSLMILSAADEAAVHAIVDVDPFLVAGVWSGYEVRALTPRTGSWIGGRQP